ncbi:MAG: hypothetical protein K0U24_03975 [Gammaproteobacteria bacterium]|nr:hypothetical protein [Gammaproteobacteria bacterium]MCH9763374.1 hypothetical protein [Gammaproteobacteria bacterium]
MLDDFSSSLGSEHSTMTADNLQEFSVLITEIVSSYQGETSGIPSVIDCIKKDLLTYLEGADKPSSLPKEVKDKSHGMTREAHAAWGSLSGMQDDESEKAAPIVRFFCEQLGVSGDSIDNLIETIACYPPKEVFNGLPESPTLDWLKAIVSNLAVRGYIELDQQNQCLALLSDAKRKQSMRQIKKPPTPELNTNTYAFVIFTLIEVMAGCSKMGMGDEDSCGIVEDSKRLADMLFQDAQFVRRIQLMKKGMKSKLNGNQADKEEYWGLLAPFMFAHAVLADTKKSKVQRGILPDTMEKFAAIQKEHLGDCLTHAATQAKEVYKSYFFDEDECEDLFGWNQEIDDPDSKLEELLINARKNALDAVGTRVLDGQSIHLNIAKQWVGTPPYSPVSPSSASPELGAKTPDFTQVSSSGIFKPEPVSNKKQPNLGAAAEEGGDDEPAAGLF